MDPPIMDSPRMGSFTTLLMDSDINNNDNHTNDTMMNDTITNITPLLSQNEQSSHDDTNQNHHHNHNQNHTTAATAADNEDTSKQSLPRLPQSESEVMQGFGIRERGFRVLFDGSINSSLSSSNTVASLASSLLVLRDAITMTNNKNRCGAISIVWLMGFATFLVPAAVPSTSVNYTWSISWYIFFGFNSLFGMYYVGLHYYYARLEAKGSDGTDESAAGATNARVVDEEITANGTNDNRCELGLEATTTTTMAIMTNETKHKPPRINYLDNIKTFLTVIVILYHTSISFGASAHTTIGSSTTTTLIIGAFDNNFAMLLHATFIEPSNKYFTSLFYFISAYFVPASYARKGPVLFARDRARRIGGGALLVTLGLCPLAMFWASRVGNWTRHTTNTTNDDAAREEDRFRYRPWPGTTWFLWWLFFLNLWYASTAAAAAVDNANAATTDDTAASANANANDNHRHHLPFSKYLSKFPSSILHRWSVGIFVCGILNKLVARYLLGDSCFIAFMPSSEFVNHLLFFYVGLVAGDNKWLGCSVTNYSDDNDDNSDDDQPLPLPLRRQLGMNVWIFRSFVLILYGSTVALSLNVHQTLPQPAIFIIESIVHGLWTVEFSVFLLESFQEYVNFKTPLSEWMSRWSYGAYLLQNILVFTMPVAVFVYAYNAGFDRSLQDTTTGSGGGGYGAIVFEPRSSVSSTVVPMTPLVIGWVYACLVYTTSCYVGASILGKLFRV